MTMSQLREVSVMKLRIVCIVMALCLISLTVVPDIKAQEDSVGRIDWVQGFITAVGYGAGKGSNNPAQDRALAIRAARTDAQRVLLETVKGVRIDSQTRVEMMMVSEDTINARVEGIVKGAQVVKPPDIQWIAGDDGKKYPAATMVLRLCLSSASHGCKAAKSLISALNLDEKKLPDSTPPQQFPTVPDPVLLQPPAPAPQAVATAPVVAPQAIALPPVQAAPEPPKAVLPGIDPTKPVTGVIVTLEGRYFEREVLPVVVTSGADQKFMTVYSAKRVRPQIIRTYGVVRYADSLDQARKISYVGDNILIIPAVKVTNDNLIVIDMDAAKKIRETVRYNNDYLGDAKVVISSN
jgi:hypothetical protein